MAHIWNLMLELGFLQSTLNALDFSSDASQAAVCSARCARCSELSTWWPWKVLDMGQWLGLSSLHRATDTLPDLDFFLKTFSPWIKAVLENFSCSCMLPLALSNQSIHSISVSWNWAVHGLGHALICLQLENQRKHGMFIIKLSSAHCKAKRQDKI